MRGMTVIVMCVVTVGIMGRMGVAVFIVVLAALTGTIAHGLMVFAQHSVPIGVISMLQLSQPVLAVTWSLLFLGARVRPVQVLGMALVMVGLVTQTREGTTLVCHANYDLMRDLVDYMVEQCCAEGSCPPKAKPARAA